jgi:putative phage-type endonuclease
VTGVHLALEQGSDAWLEARRSLITATDIGILLGLSPYRCEADLADEKLDGVMQPTNIAMKIGKAMEPVIGEEYELRTGKHIRRYRGMVRHPDIEWAAASPDAAVVGEKRLVEFKHTSSASRFADGIPQDIEAQVAWQLGVTGYPVADVAVLTRSELVVYEQEADPALFANLVVVAEDFRARLEAGGPFSRDADRVKRDHPTDDGSEMVADDELSEAVLTLASLRSQRKTIEEAEERIETAIKSRMGDVSTLVGQGFKVTWKQTKPSEQVDWKSIADGLLRQLPEPERTALVGIHSTVRQGFRPFRVTLDKE